ncbi:MAG: aminotransferase class V-fold PLP-dependent enzyme, partial [Flavobacteriaceae bacterium]|nr:aminotransferase class V-fold PLP-dependent enzyme [Flavobacteriaceae bacterium]
MKINEIQNQILGSDVLFNTPFGSRLQLYADYTASGKSLILIEKYMIELQKLYANTHTNDSMTGRVMTQILHLAEAKIKKFLHADENYYIVPAGTGATGAIVKLSEILGLYISPALKIRLQKELDMSTNERPVVFIGPYEHHSNILIWKESFAEVVEIGLNSEGYIDIDELREEIKKDKYNGRKKIGAFSAASNISGIRSDVFALARILHEYDALAVFDYAASAPYVDIKLYDGTDYLDAIYFSPHKFVGGPGSSGILIINKGIYETSCPPTVAGGGTVDYVSNAGYEFTEDVETREKAGTPGILQIIKASLAMEFKEEIGVNKIEEIEQKYITKMMNRFKKNKNIQILGPLDPTKRVSILSFNIFHDGKYLHHRLASRLLSDLFGIQSRAGCACAGPYGHILLGITDEYSEKFRIAIKEGIGSLKPGWIRINLHYLMTEEDVNFILDAIEFIADYGYLYLQEYSLDIKTGDWRHNTYSCENITVSQFGIKTAFKLEKRDVFKKITINTAFEYKKYLKEAESHSGKLLKT